MKSLDQIEPRTPISALPFTIANPGSYYVTTNLTGGAGTNGITISTSQVELDLSGFTLSGATGGPPVGILVSAGGYRNISLRNGTLRNWGNGVQTVAAAGNVRLHGLSLVQNTAAGALLYTNNMVKDCAFEGNGSSGLYAGDNTLVTGCTAVTNGSSGIVLGADSVVLGSLASHNYFGFFLAKGCTIKDCIANHNLADGVAADRSATISGCVARGNGASGIDTYEACTISGCTVEGNQSRGIYGFPGCIITACAANSNGLDGVYVGEGSMVKDCAVRTNAAIGINADGAGCTVSACTVRGNSLDGIRVTSNCLVLESNCSSNGNNSTNGGIVATGAGNRIDGNMVSLNNALGIRVIGTNNLVMRNTARANVATNYSIAPSNSNALETNPANDFQNFWPWANFSY